MHSIDDYRRFTIGYCLDVNIAFIPFEGLNVNVKNKIRIETPYEGIDVNMKNKVEIKKDQS
ncbi:hypothetical protein [Bacteroides sp.]|uniref:hypothetical protein n=1 Tax=Bacteroides sp. TaxID=29523 RepID=UPI0025C3608A|nr:hypothetical protein [Bacteroides sp.]